MSTLITGAAGFVGKHLIRLLQSEGQQNIVALALNEQEADLLREYNIDVFIGDILCIDDLKSVISRVKPEQIFHMAAQSSVELSWVDPMKTADINIKGTINLLECVRALSLKTRIMLIGSGDEYGTVSAQDMPINENTRLAPTNIYAVTKVCQNMLGNVYANAYHMDLVMTRAFNHIGPGQSSKFVVSDFCKQLVEIEKGLAEPVIRVGNTAVKRDFTDVRDVVKAYYFIMNRGVTGETYNIASGQPVSIQDILDIIISQSKVKILVELDKKRFRPTDTAVVDTDSSKLRKLTGWKNEISLEQSIKDTISYWEKYLL